MSHDIDLRPVVVWDIETCSLSDLRKVGAWRYSQDPSTQVICYAYQVLRPQRRSRVGKPHLPHTEYVPYISGQSVVVSLAGSQLSDGLRRLIDSGCVFAAHNAAFERAVWQNVLTERYGWPECPDLTRWIDTMADCLAYGLPAGLEDAAQAAGLSVTKDKAGHALMLRMARPRKVEDDGTIRWWHLEDPEKLKALRAYCAQDVRVTEQILNTVPRLTRREKAIWRLDAEVNARGIRVDLGLVNRMQKIAESVSGSLNAEVDQLTFGYVTALSQVSRITHYLQSSCRVHVQDLAASTIERALKKQEFIPSVRRLLELRLAYAKSSVSKLKAYRAWAGLDAPLLRGLLQYMGAGRTGRWAGRGPQPHNLPRPEKWVQAPTAIRLISEGADRESLELFLGDAMTVLSACLRGCLVARPGKRLVVADFSQIEARVLAWGAQEHHLLKVFAEGGDLYVATVEAMGGTDRAFGKLTALSCQYQTGGPKLRVTARDNYGIDLTEVEADDAVRDWRGAHPNIVGLWWAMDRAAVLAVKTGKPVTVVHHTPVPILFVMWGPHLTLKLPSGRRLVYRDAAVKPHPKYGRESVCFMGVDQYTKKWSEQWGYGGFWVNNWTQGTARDLMAETMLRTVPNGALRGARRLLWLLLTVHDELVCEADAGVAKKSLAKLLEWMETPVGWAPGLQLKGEGYVAERFRKS